MCRGRDLAHRARARALLQQLLRIGQTGIERLALAQAVHEAHLDGLGRRNRHAGRRHLDRGLGPDKARRALRAAGTGDHAELGLGQAQLRARNGDAVMRAKRDLQPAAQGRAVDRGDDRLGAGLDAVHHVGQRGLHRRLAELGDVGAADEQAPRAVDHRDLSGIGLEPLDRFHQPGPHVAAQRVHRRMIHRDDRDPAPAFEMHCSCHVVLPLRHQSNNRPNLFQHANHNSTMRKYDCG